MLNIKLCFEMHGVCFHFQLSLAVIVSRSFVMYVIIRLCYGDIVRVFFANDKSSDNQFGLASGEI